MPTRVARWISSLEVRALLFTAWRHCREVTRTLTATYAANAARMTVKNQRNRTTPSERKAGEACGRRGPDMRGPSIACYVPHLRRHTARKDGKRLERAASRDGTAMRRVSPHLTADRQPA